MTGRFAPGAKVEPLTPGFVARVSVRVLPCLASISRDVAIDNGTNELSGTTSNPASAVLALSGVGLDGADAGVAFDFAAGVSGFDFCVDVLAGFFDFAIGLGLTTTISGSFWASCATAALCALIVTQLAATSEGIIWGALKARCFDDMAHVLTVLWISDRCSRGLPH